MLGTLACPFPVTHFLVKSKGSKDAGLQTQAEGSTHRLSPRGLLSESAHTNSKLASHKAKEAESQELSGQPASHSP